MLNTVIREIAAALSDRGASPVYSAFDAADIRRKGSGVFTVVEVRSLESFSPIYSALSIFLPFKAEASIRVTAPRDWDMKLLYAYFDDHIAPAIGDMSSLTSSLRSLSLKQDSNIGRLVLTATLSVSGVVRSERSEQ